MFSKWNQAVGQQGLMIFLVSCGSEKPEGLQVVVLQEHLEEGKSHATIVDFDEDPPKRIELRVGGEAKDGFELIEVYDETKTVVLRREGKEIRLKMKEGE